MFRNSLEQEQLSGNTSSIDSSFGNRSLSVLSLNQKTLKDSGGKAFMELAKFCLKLLAAKDEGEQMSPQFESELVHMMTQNILDAMRLNLKQARTQFPRMLELVAACSNKSATHELFVASTDESQRSAKLIPCWMFIQWIPQMCSVLGGPEGALVMPILTRIANVYPQALYYPLQLSTESVQSMEPPNPHALQRLQNLSDIVNQHVPLLPKFVEALDGMNNPDLKFKDFISSGIYHMNRGDKEKTVQLYKELHKGLIACCRDHVGTSVGKMAQKFSTKYGGLFDKVFGKDGANIRKMTTSSFRRTLLEIQSKYFTNNPVVQPGQHPLSLVSRWLADYKDSKNAQNYIELPGQYTGTHCPDPKNHVRIIAFQQTITCMQSIRKPKALTMHGNDEKSYKFLVKGGEDLRQDQRIEQLFGAMNDILSGDAQCAKRSLNVRTYSVIPMTGSVGILEWVPGTVPLKSIVTEQAKLVENGPSIIDLLKDYVAHIGPSLTHKDYPDMLATRPEKAIVKSFDKVQNSISADLLLKGVAALCSTPESYLVLRSKFARSFAVFSICSYILGIGDRHLDNFLLDQSDGSLVGIDFGHAFGTGTQLSVPELIPFRLTRQFQHLFQPLDTEGLLKQDMCYTLSAIQNNRHTLLTIMEVFVKEPQLDWVAKAMKDFAATRSDSEDSSTSASQKMISWVAKKKIASARNKLLGHNPCLIMVEELKDNQLKRSNKTAFSKCVQYIKGDSSKFRAQNNWKVCQSVAEQVDCLVDHATDKNLLGRTWQGWMPFL